MKETMKWIIPCNLKYYDVGGAFTNLKSIDWKQSNKNIAVGDIVYVYVGNPISGVKYKCKVNKANRAFCEIDDSKFVKIGDVYERYGNYMELELIQEYNDDFLNIDKMHSLGMKGNIQSPRRLPDCLSEIL